MIARIQQTIVFLILAGLTALDLARFAGLFTYLHGIFGSSRRIYCLPCYVIYSDSLFKSQRPTTPRRLWALLLACLREAITAPSVFLWRQPFRTQAISNFLPVSDKSGVVFIHGFFCNRAFWSPWMAQLQSQNRAFASVTLEPAFGSIDDYATIVEAAVAKVTQATGQAPTLICHSMGGLGSAGLVAVKPWATMAASNASSPLVRRTLARLCRRKKRCCPSSTPTKCSVWVLGRSNWPKTSPLWPLQQIHLLVQQLRQHRRAHFHRYVAGC